MQHPPRVILENTLFIWSVVHNTVLSYVEKAMIGRHHEPFKTDEYLDRDHFEIIQENGQWFTVIKETTNGSFHNGQSLEVGTKIELKPFDILMGGDQILVIMNRDIVKIATREEFLAQLILKGDEYVEQNKSIQTRSLAFFKLEFPNFVNMIKRTEFLRKIEIASAKRAADLKPYDEKLVEIQTKRNKVAQAWDQKINEFKQAIDAIKDNE